MFGDVRDFGAWCKTERLDVPGRTRSAAMWLAKNWEAVADLNSNVSHPEYLRRLYNSDGLPRRK